MVAPRLAALRLAVPALAMVVLAACDSSTGGQGVGQRVDTARQCAAMVKDLTGLDLSPGSVGRAAARADEVARSLDDRARNVDQTEVRRAAENLAARIRRLADTAGSSTPAQREKAVRDVTEAAKRLASACKVPLDQVLTTH